MIKNEIELLSKFKDTPNVINFIESFDFDEGDDKNHQTYIVTEIAENEFLKYFKKAYNSCEKKDTKGNLILKDHERMNYFS